MTPSEAVQALIKARDRVERAALELEAAKAERKELEEIVLPPIFLQAGISTVELSNGAKATKTQFVWARLAPAGDPKRGAMLKWLHDVGEQDAVKATLTAHWGYGDYKQAKVVFNSIQQAYPNAVATLDESVQWKMLERIVLEKVKTGEPVPLTEINATFGDHVTITRNPTEPPAL